MGDCPPPRGRISLGVIHQINPPLWPGDRPGRESRRPRMQRHGTAAIGPVVGTLDQARAQRIGFDVATGIQELHVIANLHVAIPFLVNMALAYSPLSLMDSTNLR